MFNIKIRRQNDNRPKIEKEKFTIVIYVRYFCQKDPINLRNLYQFIKRKTVKEIKLIE